VQYIHLKYCCKYKVCGRSKVLCFSFNVAPCHQHRTLPVRFRISARSVPPSNDGGCFGRCAGFHKFSYKPYNRSILRLFYSLLYLLHVLLRWLGGREFLGILAFSMGATRISTGHRKATAFPSKQ